MFDPKTLVGEVLDGKYRLVSFLGKGTFGWVYSAEQVLDEFRASYAIKVLRPETPEERKAVLDEFNAAAQLPGSGMVRFHVAFDVPDGPLAGALCLVMELCEGTLADRLQAGRRLAVEEARGVARDLAEVLAWLQAQQVVHRDVKPANVFRVGKRWKLGDLGLVRAVEGSMVSASGFKGSPQYMSPEALAGKVSTASDVWSLGALLQEALTGTRVYSGGTVPELILASALEEPTIAPNLPAPFDAVVRGCLVKDPRKRWTAAQVLAVLEGGPAPAVPAVASGPRPTAVTLDAPTVDLPAPAARSTARGRTSVPAAGGRRLAVPVLSSLLVLMLGVVLWMAAYGGPKPDPRVTASSGVRSSSAGPAAPEPGAPPSEPAAPEPGAPPSEPGAPDSAPAVGAPRGLVALGRNAQGRERFQVEGVGSVLVSLPAGQFTMGSPAGEEGRDGDEVQHEVVLSRGFLLGETEVTQAEYRAVVGDNPSRFSGFFGDLFGGNPDLPVECVSWLDAVSFCNALSRRVGLEEAYVVNGCDVTWRGVSCPGFRLPTEAEWEYACRAGTTGARYAKLDYVAWWCDDSAGETHAVRGKLPNAWGLYDTLGNAWEWCWDWRGAYPSGEVRDPEGPRSGEGRVGRGGSWNNGAPRVRAACRGYWDPDGRYHDFNLGIRLAKSLP